MKKVAYLFLALLLPGLIFVFLKYGAKNQFDVPIYYVGGVASTVDDCPLPKSRPYVLPDSLWALGKVSHAQSLVMIFGQADIDTQALATAINEELGDGIITFLFDNMLSLDSMVVIKWRNCVFMVKAPMQTVLVDKEGRIRGYYDIQTREEIDRLRLELKIILERF